ncbi:hypothetical protein [Marinobacter sp.]|nr:hypothetical protein [Marinobacter sp.]HKK57545.1 hypothetical protein [Marinobacter sp.]
MSNHTDILFIWQARSMAFWSRRGFLRDSMISGVLIMACSFP